MLDYLETDFNFEEKYPGMTEHIAKADMEKVPKLRLTLKNAVLHTLVHQRNQQRQNSLKEMISNAMNAYHKMRAKKEKRMQTISKLPFMDRLDTMLADQ